MRDEEEQYKHLKEIRVCFPARKTIIPLSKCNGFGAYNFELKSFLQKSGCVKAHMEKQL